LTFKFLERIPDTRKRYYQFTAIDGQTRLRVLRIYVQKWPKVGHSVYVMGYLLFRLTFRTVVIKTNNGAEFQAQFH
jgi:hypothetical protein